MAWAQCGRGARVRLDWRMPPRSYRSLAGVAPAPRATVFPLPSRTHRGRAYFRVLIREMVFLRMSLTKSPTSTPFASASATSYPRRWTFQLSGSASTWSALSRASSSCSPRNNRFTSSTVTRFGSRPSSSTGSPASTRPSRSTAR